MSHLTKEKKKRKILILFCFISIIVSGIIGSVQRSISTLKIKLSAVEIIDTDSPNLQAFSFDLIKTATNNFSSENKLGEGGFGPVYKVILGKETTAITFLFFHCSKHIRYELCGTYVRKRCRV